MTPAPALPRTNDPLDEAFWRNCQDGVLRFQRCANCAAWRFLPRYMCARCSSPEFAWAEVAGGGAIYSWTVVHQAMHPAFAQDVPYVAAVVELDEGVRMASRLLDCHPERLGLGDRVRVTFREIGEGFQLPCFVLAPALERRAGAEKEASDGGG